MNQPRNVMLMLMMTTTKTEVFQSGLERKATNPYLVNHRSVEELHLWQSQRSWLRKAKHGKDSPVAGGDVEDTAVRGQKLVGRPIDLSMIVMKSTERIENGLGRDAFLSAKPLLL
jgi:hypothetical protein